MEELKNYLLDQISFYSNYNYNAICFGPSSFEIDLKRKTFQEVLDKLREIEKK